jgi:hypothetical protein
MSTVAWKTPKTSTRGHDRNPYTGNLRYGCRRIVPHGVVNNIPLGDLDVHMKNAILHPHHHGGRRPVQLHAHIAKCGLLLVALAGVVWGLVPGSPRYRKP